MAMAQLLNIRMPGSYEVTFPPQNPDMPGGDGPGKGAGQSGMHLKIVVDVWTIMTIGCESVSRHFHVTLPPTPCRTKKCLNHLLLIY